MTLLVWRWFCGSVNSLCWGSTQQDLSKDFIWFDSLDGWREGGSWCLHEVQQTLHTFDWFGSRQRNTNRVRCQNPSTTQSVILVSRLHAFKSMQGFLPLGRLRLFQYGASVWSLDVVQKCWISPKSFPFWLNIADIGCLGFISWQCPCSASPRGIFLLPPLAMFRALAQHMPPIISPWPACLSCLSGFSRMGMEVVMASVGRVVPILKTLLKRTQACLFPNSASRDNESQVEICWI